MQLKEDLHRLILVITGNSPFLFFLYFWHHTVYNPFFHKFGFVVYFKKIEFHKSGILSDGAYSDSEAVFNNLTSLQFHIIFLFKPFQNQLRVGKRFKKNPNVCMFNRSLKLCFLWIWIVLNYVILVVVCPQSVLFFINFVVFALFFIIYIYSIYCIESSDFPSVIAM